MFKLIIIQFIQFMVFNRYFKVDKNQTSTLGIDL